MHGQPAQPAAKRAELFVDGSHIRPGGLAGEGGVGETEPKVGVELGAEGAGLLVEDSGVGAAAMKAKEAREAES